jgi:hypothetical protein
MPVLVFIDSNVFVNWKASGERNARHSKEFVEGMVLSGKNVFETRTGKPREFVFCTSYYTLLEVASAMARRAGDLEAKKLVYDLAKWWDKVKKLDSGEKRFSFLVNEAIKTAFEYKIPSGDAIQANIFLSNYSGGEAYLVTWNKRDFENLARKNPGLALLTPTEFLRVFRSG